MPGRMGGKVKTVKGLVISYIDKENGILGIKGAIPGHKNTFVIIRK
jgi:large subunit ribosomal protein L3